MDVCPQQVRAARALLDWSQRDLAQAAQIAVSTIADFERDVRKMMPANMRMIVHAFNDAGVEFIPRGVVMRDGSAKEP
ncbi:hypothetical protein WM27_09605 [Burkholderia ubonensis]|uniref:helix-turn-helix domain-containing protein n=1 Tax=Burkholderia ubonensis TaxID=101571 RepID=UPI000757C21A|nr:helix-turn-helix transcriptional regulator [Burkholderia ubonensis]KVT60622.1 hypothetical protein WK55_09765 [Burkholderia ubonensis]KWN78340.1 hypothetical protein WM24_29630 [Burkholderia ubonensis]KWO23237.1 hypothetical protein WM27_09605 [Burkholderia ubonensis]ODQ34535.1 hypothetical protein BGV65_12185 [Burkholderia ubonensis]